MKARTLRLLLLAVFMCLAVPVVAQEPPRECTPTPPEPNDDYGKPCRMGNGDYPPPAPLPQPQPDAVSMEALLARLAPQLVERGTFGRGREGR